MARWPTVRDVASELRAINANVEWTTEVCLQVRDDGWTVWVGAQSATRRAIGRWGCSTIPGEGFAFTVQDSREIASAMIAEARGHGDNPWRLFSNPQQATKLSGGPKALIEKLAKAPPEFARSKQGTEMATRALRVVEQQNPEQADVFLAELVALGYAPRLRNSSLSANPRGGYHYRMAYEVVSEESAAEGEAEERGWEEERSEDYRSLYDLLRDVSSKANWLEWSSSRPTGQDWIVSEDEQDYRTGDYTRYDLFIRRNDGQPLSQREIRYICDELRLHGCR